ncbi:MAG: NERD domain-containing protein, partial [Bacillus sp. (in: Bacteria)]|nr:NERD domain-containing protein [Bacillus sp. (in: firmicutes)]
VVRRALFCRDGLDENQRRYYLNLENGYKGECIFDEYVKALPDDWLILNDLTLEHNNTTVQIDSLLASSKNLYLIDTKYLENDYFFNKEDERFYPCHYNGDGKDYLMQLRRCESNFRTILTSAGLHHFTVISRLVFVHPAFSLYELPREHPAVVLPTQINRFIDNIKKQPAGISSAHRKLADHLLTKCVSKKNFDTAPDYTYEGLKKGLFCGGCLSEMVGDSWYSVKCRKCGCEEKIDDAVLRAIEDYILLFPERPLTTVDIWDWCGGWMSDHIIRRILKTNFQVVGWGKYAIYK